jgi:hypothetical protein
VELLRTARRVSTISPSAVTTVSASTARPHSSVRKSGLAPGSWRHPKSTAGLCLSALACPEHPRRARTVLLHGAVHGRAHAAATRGRHAPQARVGRRVGAEQKPERSQHFVQLQLAHPGSYAREPVCLVHLDAL